MLRGLRDNFASEGYGVAVAEDGERGLEAVLNAPVDLVILDIMLPGVNGYEICRRMRQEKIDTPVIMLTAKSDTIDVVVELQCWRHRPELSAGRFADCGGERRSDRYHLRRVWAGRTDHRGSHRRRRLHGSGERTHPGTRCEPVQGLRD